MKAQISKEEKAKLLKEALKKQQVLSCLIKEDAFSRNDNQLWNMLGHSSSTIVQNIKGQSISKPDTIDNHWNNFTKRFKITDEGMYRLLDTLEKYNREPLHKRNNPNYTLNLLKRADKLYEQRKEGVYEFLAFVGLGIYEEMCMQRNYENEIFLEKLRSLFMKIWPDKDFIINNRCLNFFPLDMPELSMEISKYSTIICTTALYFCYKGDNTSARNMPYSIIFKDSFPYVSLGESTYWVTDEPGNIWYVYFENLEDNEKYSCSSIAVFEPYVTKCAEIIRLVFITNKLVMIGSYEKVYGFYEYTIADDGKSVAFENPFGNTYKLPEHIYLSCCEADDRVRFLKKNKDEDSILDLRHLRKFIEITDIAISRTYITVGIPDGVNTRKYIMSREKCPDLHHIHPDTPVYYLNREGKDFVAFTGDYPLCLSLEDFEPLTNEE